MGDPRFARLPSSLSVIQAALFVIPDLIRDPASSSTLQRTAGSRIKSGMTSKKVGSAYHG
jgi:hypothetical protein